jgi:hypothetical protein
MDPSAWMSAHLRTYVQSDVRLICNILDLGAFNRFVQIVATCAGQLINKDSIGKAAGVDAKTVQSWLSLLKSSYIIYLLPPFFENLNKQVIKTPKLFLFDRGLLCYLLNVGTEESLRKSRDYRSVLENWALSAILKNRANQGMHGGMYFFRDSGGNEVDVLLEKDERPWQSK